MSRSASLAKARIAAAKARKRERMSKLHDAIVETGQRFPTCHCDITTESSLAHIRGLGSGCTDPQFACPRLDAIRRRTDSWS